MYLDPMGHPKLLKLVKGELDHIAKKWYKRGNANDYHPGITEIPAPGGSQEVCGPHSRMLIVDLLDLTNTIFPVTCLPISSWPVTHLWHHILGPIGWIIPVYTGCYGRTPMCISVFHNLEMSAAYSTWSQCFMSNSCIDIHHLSSGSISGEKGKIWKGFIFYIFQL